jgi:GNAT superfamily N-acetyltransferase
VQDADLDLQLLERLNRYIQATAGPGAAVVIEELEPERAASLRDAAHGPITTRELLTCAPADLRTPPDVPGLTIVTLDATSPVDDVRAGLDANELGFDPSAAPASNAQAEHFRRGLVTNRAFVARVDGEIAGGGMFNPPIDGVAEIVGIGTLAAFRRRGVGAAVTARAAQTAFELGVDLVFLSTHDPGARRIYERLAFTLRATLLTAN